MSVEGISFMMRVRNEEGTLEESIRSLFALKIPYEIVVVLHLCTDGSRAIAEKLRAENDKIRILEYTIETSRAGYETLATDSESKHSLPTYYTWCLRQTRLPWVFKWDADFVATEGLIQFLNGVWWAHWHGRYSIEARSSSNSVRDVYLACGFAYYYKCVFWEIAYFVAPLQCHEVYTPPPEAYIRHASSVSDIKSHWVRVPWYTTEDSDEARLVTERLRRLTEDFGPEPHGLARSGNEEAHDYQLRIQKANPEYIRTEL